MFLYNKQSQKIHTKDILGAWDMVLASTSSSQDPEGDCPAVVQSMPSPDHFIDQDKLAAAEPYFWTWSLM